MGVVVVGGTPTTRRWRSAYKSANAIRVGGDGDVGRGVMIVALLVAGTSGIDNGARVEWE